MATVRKTQSFQDATKFYGESTRQGYGRGLLNRWFCKQNGNRVLGSPPFMGSNPVRDGHRLESDWDRKVCGSCSLLPASFWMLPLIGERLASKTSGA